MSLFVGNLSKNVTFEQLREVFEIYGQCKVQKKTGFAFIKYENEHDGEKAISKEKDRNMGGLVINIEWSKSSTRFDPAESTRPPPRKRKEAGRNVECYNCRGRGHYARDCTSRRRSRSPRRDRRRSRSRSRSDSRRRDRRREKRRGDSRSDDRGRDDSRSDYRHRRDRRDKYDDRHRRKRRDSRERDDDSRSPPRYKRHERDDFRGGRDRSGSPRGDRNVDDQGYSNEHINTNQDADYSKNEPDLVRNDDYEKNGNEGGVPHEEVQIDVDTKEKEINAGGGGDDHYEHQQNDSYAENNQQNDEVRGDDHREEHHGNPEADVNDMDTSLKKDEKDHVD